MKYIETTTPIKAFRIDCRCVIDNCPGNYVRAQKPIVIENGLALLPHVCDTCGVENNLDKQYPNYEIDRGEPNG